MAFEGDGRQHRLEEEQVVHASWHEEAEDLHGAFLDVVGVAFLDAAASLDVRDEVLLDAVDEPLKHGVEGHHLVDASRDC